MKSVPRLIHRFVGILLLSILLLVILNVIFCALVFMRNVSKDSAWETAEQTAAALRMTDGHYVLPDSADAGLKEQKIWGILIDEDTHRVVWQTDGLPDSVPRQYTLADIAELTRGYVDGYPAFTGKAENGLLVLGYPKDSYWKHTRANWDYRFIANLPRNLSMGLAVNVILIFLIYVAANAGLLRSVRPIADGIQELSRGVPVHIVEKGVLSELAENINVTSELLQEQAKRLRKRETARANWIAGVSHDIRTPLSMVMGYAEQLRNSEDILEAGRKKAAAIVRQSGRIRSLVNDLNLASRLEYTMQPLMKKRENAVAVVRQVVVDFMNLDITDRFPIEWKTDDGLSVCLVDADKELLKRAVSNLIQNSINHNEDGCGIYVAVCEDGENCRIRVEDNGAGVTDEQIARLNRAPHYMECGTETDGQRHGLGLLIVKQIINGHGGQVSIDHSVYGGFKAVLTIPKSNTPL
ncbi:MAG TPA: two-component sensor histidine kinase [Lachnospiraceae bacterium]|nr:two-component sensor histidine kinase [Lachnospiraceae bacterium]